MNWTREQTQAIEIRDKSILVSAAAGSGKTAVLVERIKSIISNDKVPLENMLVVTFTNAAASEMREKIVSAIPEQLHSIHKAHICTFHSFALEVIKRYFHIIKIEPNYKICDDIQKSIIQADAMEELFRNKFATRDKDFLMFLRHYARSKNEEIPKSIVMTVYEFIQSLPEPMKWLEENIDKIKWDENRFKKSHAFMEIIDDMEEELNSSFLTSKAVLRMVKEAGVNSLIPKAAADAKMIQTAISYLHKDFDYAARMIQSASFQKYATTKAERENYNHIKDDVTVLRSNMKDSINRLNKLYCIKPLSEYIDEVQKTEQLAMVLAGLVKDFNELYRIKKQKLGVMDFSDIEHYALDILSRSEAADEYREKFHYIFIDEYQDSNLVQESIISKIKRNNNLFMVGDVKQSIYKFRLAEPEIFIKKYESFSANKCADEMKLDLNKNFRSKRPIIDVVNHIFKQIMTKRNAGMEYSNNDALYYGLSYKGSLEYPVELHLVEDRQFDDDSLDEELREMKKAELEAFTAAQLIKKARGLAVFDPKTGEERNIQNKDIVILLRSVAGIGEIYYDTLQQEGIPVYMDAGDGYFDTLEVSVFLNLLKVIDNSRQDVALLSVLRSPIFSFSISQMSQIRLPYKKGAYHRAFAEYADKGSEIELRDKCKSVLQRFQQWRIRSRLIPLSDFLWELITDTGYYHYVGALPGGDQRQANLRALVDRAFIYEKQQSKGLFGFMNYIEAMKKRKVAVAPVKLLGESDDVVRIMTVHKSKGLEFPFVLVGGLGKRFNRETGNEISLHKDYGLALRQVDPDMNYRRNTIMQNIIINRRNRDDLAEEIRILYVALTRAMDKLTLLGTVSDGEKALEQALMKNQLGIYKGNCYLDFLLPALYHYSKVSCTVHNRKDIGTIMQEQSEERKKTQISMEKGFTVDAQLYKLIQNRFGWRYSHPFALKTKSKYSVTELSRINTDTQYTHVDNIKWELDDKTKFSQKGMERGIAYHKIMEHIPFHASYVNDINNVRNFISELIAKEIISEEEAALVNPDKILSFFTSELGKRACNADQLYREIPFNLLKEKDGEEIIVQGIIDCYFKESCKHILIDFKSNLLSNKKGAVDMIKEKYKPQLYIYKEALEQIRGINVDEVYLYFFDIDRIVKI